MSLKPIDEMKVFLGKELTLRHCRVSSYILLPTTLTTPEIDRGRDSFR
jgi:hypothetical protein